MKTRTKKFLASGALAVSLGALALGVSGVGPALATTSGPDPDPAGGFSTTLGASTETGEWCGWYLRGVDSDLTLMPVIPTQDTYTGVEIELEVEDTELSAFVNGTSVYSNSSDNCSWYGNANKQAVSVTVTAADNEFTATTTEGSDTSMDFFLTDLNPLTLTVTEGAECATNGFFIDSLDEIAGADLTSEPVTSAVSSAVQTTDTCGWDVTYGVSIPEDLVPTYGGAAYVYTGPTLTTTLEVD